MANSVTNALVTPSSSKIQIISHCLLVRPTESSLLELPWPGANGLSQLDTLFWKWHAQERSRTLRPAFEGCQDLGSVLHKPDSPLDRREFIGSKVAFVVFVIRSTEGRRCINY